MQSVELVLDDDSDRRVRRHWAKLADAGVPSQARHTGPANRPHITLAVTSDMSRSVQANIEVVLGRLPLPLTLGAWSSSVPGGWCWPGWSSRRSVCWPCGPT